MHFLVNDSALSQGRLHVFRCSFLRSPDALKRGVAEWHSRNVVATLGGAGDWRSSCTYSSSMAEVRLGDGAGSEGASARPVIRPNCGQSCSTRFSNDQFFVGNSSKVRSYSTAQGPPLPCRRSFGFLPAAFERLAVLPVAQPAVQPVARHRLPGAHGAHFSSASFFGCARPLGRRSPAAQLLSQLRSSSRVVQLSGALSFSHQSYTIRDGTRLGDTKSKQQHVELEKERCRKDCFVQFSASAIQRIFDRQRA